MTITDIFNRALAMIGHDRYVVAGVTTSTEYIRCNLEWDGARLAILSAHDWNWLAQETPLMQGAESLDDFSNALEYVYDRPDGIIRLIGVYDGASRRVAYRTANGSIYAVLDEVKFRYLIDSEVPDDWPAHVVDAVCAELASRIALPMSANGKVVQAMKQLQGINLAKAIEHDAGEQNRSGSSGTKYADSRR